MNKKVSIIVITKNSARTISDCLESIVCQNYPKDQYEVIVVDGASTDNTVKICRKYPVKVIELEVYGIPLQRNIGIVNAQGEYVAFLDSDDTAEKNWIEKSVSYLDRCEEENVVGVGCSHSLSNNNSDFLRFAWLEHSFRHSRLLDEVNHIGTSGAVFKKSVIGDIGGFDTRLQAAEDMDLSSRIIKSGHKIHLFKAQLIKVEYAHSLLKYFKKQIKNIAFMVVFFLKPKSVRATRGAYSNYSEHIQGFLPILFVISSLILLNYGVLIALSIWILALLSLNIPFLSFVSHHRGESRVSRTWILLVLPYLFLRSVAWCFGLVYGTCLAIKTYFESRSNKEEPISESNFKN